MKIQSFGDLLGHFGYSDEKPSKVVCIEISKLTEQLRSAWNFGHSIGQREEMDEHHREEAAEAASMSPESWVRMGARGAKKKPGGRGT